MTETKLSPFCKELPQKINHKAIRRAVDKVLDSMEVGTKFSGSELPQLCAQIEPICARTEGETLRRYMRYYRSRGRGGITCIDRQKSIYMKTAVEEDTDACLGELFAALDKEDKQKNNDYKNLRAQIAQINNFLTNKGVPVYEGARELSVYERVVYLFKHKKIA